MQFEQYFRPSLRMHGYEGIFSPKSRAKTMGDWERTFVDGCAIFWKADQFKLEDKHVLIEFNQSALGRPGLRKHKDVYNRVMTRDNIAVVARLEHIKTRRPVLVTNCHIHWDPRYKDVKLLQTVMMMEEVERLCAQLPPSGAVILCGDFNSLPDSGVCEFLGNGSIPAGHADFLGHTYEPYTGEGCRHNANLRNAYSLLTEETELDAGATPFTNYTPNFFGTIDYIWYRPTTLSVTGILGSIPTDYIKQLVGLPSQHFPSDHVALMVEFKFEPATAASTSPPSTMLNTTPTVFRSPSMHPQQQYMQHHFPAASIGATLPQHATPPPTHPQQSSPPLTFADGLHHMHHPASLNNPLSNASSPGLFRDGDGKRLYSRNKSAHHS